MRIIIERKGISGSMLVNEFNDVLGLSQVQYRKNQMIYGIAAKTSERFIIIAEFIIPSERNSMLDKIYKAAKEANDIKVSYLWQYRSISDSKALSLLRRKIENKPALLASAIEKAKRKSEQWNIPFDYNSLTGEDAAYKHGWALPVPTKFTLLGINPEQYFSYLLT